MHIQIYIHVQLRALVVIHFHLYLLRKIINSLIIYCIIVLECNFKYIVIVITAVIDHYQMNIICCISSSFILLCFYQYFSNYLQYRVYLIISSYYFLTIISNYFSIFTAYRTTRSVVI